MKTIKDIFNETLNETSLVEKSLYFKSGNKVVRFSDHISKMHNLVENNEGVEEILFVFVNSGLTENEIENSCEEFESELNLSYCSYQIWEDNNSDYNNIEYLTNRVQWFLNN